MIIDVDKLYDLMADKGFQDPLTGNLFFPAYIFTYDPKQEYEFRKELKMLEQKLARPNNSLESLSLNIFEEIVNYLKSRNFGDDTVLELMRKKELDEDESITHWVRDEVTNNDTQDEDELTFFEFLSDKVQAYFKEKDDKKVYLILHGFGIAFPYLRASELLKNMEQKITNFKIIIFYPGHYENSQFSLFGMLNDENMYRANNLNLQLQDSIL